MVQVLCFGFLASDTAWDLKDCLFFCIPWLRFFFTFCGYEVLFASFCFLVLPLFLVFLSLTVRSLCYSTKNESS